MNVASRPPTTNVYSNHRTALGFGVSRYAIHINNGNAPNSREEESAYFSGVPKITAPNNPMANPVPISTRIQNMAGCMRALGYWLAYLGPRMNDRISPTNSEISH